MTLTAKKSQPATIRKVAYVMRLATAYLVVPHDTDDTVEYAQRLATALENDSRVLDTHLPALDPEWSPQRTAYSPVENEDDMSGVLDARRHIHFQEFSRPIEIRVRVPTKNQPKVFEGDEIASEHYLVLWDGQVLLVAWEQAIDRYVGSSGGHVVEDILQQASERAGADLIVQACNPQCTYVFLHTAIRATIDAAAPAAGSISRGQRDADARLINVVLPDGESLDDVAYSVWWRVGTAQEYFARMKNRGRQILELEHVVRNDLDGLNQLHHERARAGQAGPVARVRALWTYRRWRRSSRYYLARLWLGLGSLERLRREWSDDVMRFRRETDDDLSDLFAVDAPGEIALVEQLDLRLVESAVEHAGDRLSANVLAYATAGGAVAGGLAAAIVNAL
jgi:hypothetical protein